MSCTSAVKSTTHNVTALNLLALKLVTQCGVKCRRNLNMYFEHKSSYLADEIPKITTISHRRKLIRIKIKFLILEFNVWLQKLWFHQETFLKRRLVYSIITFLNTGNWCLVCMRQIEKVEEHRTFVLDRNVEAESMFMAKFDESRISRVKRNVSETAGDCASYSFEG